MTAPIFAAVTFPDVAADSSYAEAVSYVSGAGIMVGDDHGNFNPTKTVTRAEMATIICRMLDESTDKSSDFSDVPSNHWANGYIGKAVKLGIVNGYGGGKFGPSDNVTYEQAVTMLMRTIGGADLAAKSGGYPDGFLKIANDHGLLEGVNTRKGNALSRGDIAKIIFNCAGFWFYE